MNYSNNINVYIKGLYYIPSMIHPPLRQLFDLNNPRAGNAMLDMVDLFLTIPPSVDFRPLVLAAMMRYFNVFNSILNIYGSTRNCSP